MTSELDEERMNTIQDIFFFVMIWASILRRMIAAMKIAVRMPLNA
jgi:hypothetical protein